MLAPIIVAIAFLLTVTVDTVDKAHVLPENQLSKSTLPADQHSAQQK